MSARKPVTLVNGVLQMLQSSDTLDPVSFSQAVAQFSGASLNYLAPNTPAQLVLTSNAASSGLIYMQYNTANQTGGVRVYDGGTSNYAALMWNKLTLGACSIDYGVTTTGVLTISSPTAFTSSTAPVLSSPLLPASGGTGLPYGAGTALTAATAALSTTDTILATLPLGAGALAVGTTFAFRCFGTHTTTAVNANTFTIRFGTTGTTSDATIGTWACNSTSSGAAVPFSIEFQFVVRTTGASATIFGYTRLQNGSNATTGICQFPEITNTVTVNSFTSAVSNGILSVSYKSAATTSASTFQYAQMTANP